MKISDIKKYKGKLVNVFWLDPKVTIRTELKDVLKDPFGTHKNSGVIIYVTAKLVILQHDDCDGEIDCTTLHPALIDNIKTV